MSAYRNAERYRYSIDMENALRRFGGKKYDDFATLCEDQELLKKALLEVVSTIRKRIENISTDVNFKKSLAISIETLTEEIQYLNKKNNNDLDIIAALLDTNALLLGFDQYDGRTHKEVNYS